MSVRHPGATLEMTGTAPHEYGEVAEYVSLVGPLPEASTDRLGEPRSPDVSHGATAEVDRTAWLETINLEPLLILAEWHDARAVDQERFALNADTEVWRTGCERRAGFHRMIADYLRNLHARISQLEDLPASDQEIVLPCFLPNRKLLDRAFPELAEACDRA